MLAWMLVAYHREYLRALRRPVDTRLRGLMSYAWIAQRQEKQRRAEATMKAGEVLMQAGMLRRVIEAGQEDIARIKAEFEKNDADREALLAQARDIQAATSHAVSMLKQIEATVTQAESATRTG